MADTDASVGSICTYGIMPWLRSVFANFTSNGSAQPL